MYRIIKIDGTELGLTDSVNYIKLHENGCFVQCPVSEAIGVAYNSEPFNLYGHDSIEGADTVIVTIVDGGQAVGAAQETIANTAAISAQMSVAARLFVQDATTIEDRYALQMPDLFRSWDDALSSGSALTANTIVNKDGALYRVVQSVTPLESQPPDMAGMLAIYRPIEPSHAGTQEDPIPWAYGMDCTSGSYYRYGGVTYRCAGDMVPCVWAPGTSGVWQWEETE